MNALRLVAVVLMLAAAHACVDQTAPYPPGGTGGRDGTGGGTGGTAGGAGEGGSGGSGGSGGTAGSNGAGGAGGQAGAGGIGGAGGGTTVGACNNPLDMAALTTLTTNPRAESALCALTCQGFFTNETDFTICVQDCVVGQIAGLSPECAACYAALEWCNGNSDPFCWNQCATSPCDSSPDGCLSCSLECRNELDLCTGLLSTDCDT